MKKIPYASTIESLMYAMVYTRPDIAQAIRIVNRFMKNPGREHWQVMKWILRYLIGIIKFALHFGFNTNDGLQGYVDSYLGDDKDGGRSIIGYIFIVGGTVISWILKLQ